MRFKRGLAGVYWYYALWQRQLARKARALHAEHHFDLAHHVTFASDWLPCGLRFGPKIPLIWGPVGGATHFPRAMARWVGLRGYLSEAFRDLSTGIMRRIWSDPMARRSNLVVCQNPDVARRFEHLAPVLVEPNAAFREEPASFVPGSSRDPKRAVFVGRLVGWKGVRLALTCLADPRLADWTLDFYGEGDERGWLEAEIARLGPDQRVQGRSAPVDGERRKHPKEEPLGGAPQHIEIEQPQHPAAEEQRVGQLHGTGGHQPRHEEEQRHPEGVQRGVDSVPWVGDAELCGEHHSVVEDDQDDGDALGDVDPSFPWRAHPGIISCGEPVNGCAEP